MSHVVCEGWWEQRGYGRQPMEQLQLVFEADGNLAGSGIDLIGPFTLTGRLEGSHVAIIKHYVGGHDVDYLGEFDGEGTLQGTWHIDWLHGPWLIKIVAASQDAAIQELRATPDATA